jgi:hypothetical protein
VTAWGSPLLLRAFAREGEDGAHRLLADFLAELEERVADGPERYRWDYIQALVICRKVDGSARRGRAREVGQRPAERSTPRASPDP